VRTTIHLSSSEPGYPDRAGFVQKIVTVTRPGPVLGSLLFGVGPGCSLGDGKAQGVVIFFEFEAEGFDDEVVVVALGQAGDGD
jgi:hypothetical protein